MAGHLTRRARGVQQPLGVPQELKEKGGKPAHRRRRWRRRPTSFLMLRHADVEKALFGAGGVARA
jgi:hypothetical protein